VSTSKPDLVVALRESLGESGSPAGSHPAPEELADYLEGRLSAGAEEEIGSHLLDCEDCSALLLELDGLKRETPETVVADFETAAAWRHQRARLFGDASTSWFGVRALAASLALVSLGLGVWIVALERRLERLRAPQLEVPIANLEPLGSMRDPGSLTSVAIPADAIRWVLILNLIEDSEAQVYRLEMTDSEGRRVTAQDGLRKSPTGGFRLSLPRDFVPPGVYRIRLADGRDDRTIEEYSLRIEP